jgi:hypothetical protein
MLEKWETTEERIWVALLAGGTVGALLLGLVLTILAFIYFGPSGCRLNQTFVSINLLLCVAATGLSVAPAVQEANPKSGLAQAGIVVVYATYLVLSAMSSEPISDGETSCNPLGKSGSAKNSTIIVGAIITFVCIAYSTTRAAGQGISLPDGETDHLIPTTTQPSAPNAALNQALESGAIRPSTLTDDDDYHMNDDEVDGTTYNYSWFHFVFAAAAMYVAMLITNWTTVSVGHDGFTNVGRGWASVWVRASTSWLVLVLYVWTLLGPVLLPDREWNY